MNYILFGVTIPQDKKVCFALNMLYGIGVNTSILICQNLILSPQLKVSELTEDQQYKIAKYVKNNFIVEGTLEEQIKLNFQRYQINTSQHGYRLRTGLPVRGQRTHSNGNTARRRQMNQFNIKIQYNVLF
jgi:small subunit ribosomal protein S13